MQILAMEAEKEKETNVKVIEQVENDSLGDLVEDDNEEEEEESHSKEPLTEKEIEELIAELIEVESKAAEAQEALEEESLAKVEADVRKELAQSHSGDALDKAVAEEMAAFEEEWEVELDELETESANLLEQLDGAGIELSSLYKWIEKQAPNGCCTEAWKKRTHWAGTQLSFDATESIAQAEEYLQIHRPVKRQHGKILEEGASGFLGRKIVTSENNVAINDGANVDWDCFNKMCSERSSLGDVKFGSERWATVYLANTPQQAAELGLKFPGVDEVEEIGDINGTASDPFVADVTANERDLNVTDQQKKNFKQARRMRPVREVSPLLVDDVGESTPRLTPPPLPPLANLVQPIPVVVDGNVSFERNTLTDQLALHSLESARPHFEASSSCTVSTMGGSANEFMKKASDLEKMKEEFDRQLSVQRGHNNFITAQYDELKAKMAVLDKENYELRKTVTARTREAEDVREALKVETAKATAAAKALEDTQAQVQRQMSDLRRQMAEARKDVYEAPVTLEQKLDVARDFLRSPTFKRICAARREIVMKGTCKLVISQLKALGRLPADYDGAGLNMDLGPDLLPIPSNASADPGEPVVDIFEPLFEMRHLWMVGLDEETGLPIRRRRRRANPGEPVDVDIFAPLLKERDLWMVGCELVGR